jgi:hypothetical protein
MHTVRARNVRDSVKFGCELTDLTPLRQPQTRRTDTSGDPGALRWKVWRGKTRQPEEAMVHASEIQT